MFQIKVPKEMAEKQIEEYKISDKAIRYMHRKGIKTVWEAIDRQPELCKTVTGKKYYDELKVALAWIILDIKEVQK